MNRTLPVCLLITLSCSFVAVPAASAQTPTLDAQQSAFLTLINTFRAQNGAGALQVSVALQNSAQWMSGDMAIKNYFSHTDSMGRDPFTRMAAFGYSYQTYEGENIAAGYSDAQNTFTQWQTACDADATGACTYAHRQNMLNPAYKVIGIGRANNAASTYKWYWTTDFGGVVDQTIGTPPPPPSGTPTITSFTATPSAISPGQSVTLSWNVSGATSLSIDIGVGSVTGLTSKIVAPTLTTKYTLTATNSTGSVTATTTVTASTTSAASTIYGTTAPSLSMYLNAGAPIELGLKFRSDVTGNVTGIRFYKIASDRGTHTGSLWSSNGTLLATGTFVNETASGWQVLQFSTPVRIAANTTYIASFHDMVGLSAVTMDLQSRGVDNAPLHALQSGVDGYNGVYVYGNGGIFPNQGTNGYDFWVDMTFAK
jgi:uncharacterized protein YkwD